MPARAERVSGDLRLGAGAFLEQRRRLAWLTSVGIGAFGVVGLYQFGVISRVPEFRAGPFDADRVDASGEAYALGNAPYAALGIVNAGLTLVLVGMGDRERSSAQPLGRRLGKRTPDRIIRADAPAGQPPSGNASGQFLVTVRQSTWSPSTWSLAPWSAEHGRGGRRRRQLRRHVCYE